MKSSEPSRAHSWQYAEQADGERLAIGGASARIVERQACCGRFQLRQQLPGNSRPEGEDESARNVDQDVIQLRVHRSETVAGPEL